MQYGIPGAIKVLIVDDTDVIRKVMLMLFRKLGIAAEAVENGLDAVERMRIEHFDLIMMDLRMPFMDGLLATKIIRSEKGAVYPVIIGLSGDGSDEDIRACRDAGMDAHVVKPPKVDSLLTLIGDIFVARSSAQ